MEMSTAGLPDPDFGRKFTLEPSGNFATSPLPFESFDTRPPDPNLLKNSLAVAAGLLLSITRLFPVPFVPNFPLELNGYFFAKLEMLAPREPRLEDPSPPP